MNVGTGLTHVHVWHRAESGERHWLLGDGWHATLTIRGRYLGSIAKGWWSLARSCDYFELETAIGGEDNMLQAGVAVPLLGHVHAGVRIPRALTSGWIYERRDLLTVRVGYVGRWIELLIGSDEHMRDTGMVEYYQRKRAQPDCADCRHAEAFHQNTQGRCITISEIEHGCEPCSCSGYRPESLRWSQAQLWPGWHLTFAPRLKDRLLGRMVYELTEGPLISVLVPLPEGNYPGWARTETRTWQRPRWPFSRRTRLSWWIDMSIAPPAPGKGENSWDCEDDAIYGTGGQTLAEAIANITRAALREREKYGSPGWTPAAGWPAGITRT